MADLLPEAETSGSEDRHLDRHCGCVRLSMDRRHRLTSQMGLGETGLLVLDAGCWMLDAAATSTGLFGQSPDRSVVQFSIFNCMTEEAARM